MGPANEILANVSRRMNETYKAKMQRNVFLALLLLSGLFVFLYVPEEVIVPLRDRLSGWATGLLSTLFASSSVYFFLQWAVFAQDHLANGNSPSSQFFRHYYPSSFARHKYGLSTQRANRLWFEYYNTWQREGHPRHEAYRTNARRSYSLRLIYYLKYLLLYFAVLAAMVTLGNRHVIGEARFNDLLPSRLACIVALLAISYTIMKSNRFRANNHANYYEKFSATGAYEKYKEFQGLLWEYFEEDVLEPLRRQKKSRVRPRQVSERRP